jgi:hypothetical protein
MKAYEGNGCMDPYLLSSVLVDEWSALRPGRFSPGKEPPLASGQQPGRAPKPIWTTWKRDNSCHYRDSNSEPSVIQHVEWGKDDLRVKQYFIKLSLIIFLFCNYILTKCILWVKKLFQFTATPLQAADKAWRCVWVRM